MSKCDRVIFGAFSENINFIYICSDVVYISLTCLFCFSSHSNNNATEQFQINLTASCNFGCACDMNDVQPVCGANGLTYFSPCHAGCTSSPGAKSDNYTNCACKYSILWNCSFRKIQKKYYCNFWKYHGILLTTGFWGKEAWCPTLKWNTRFFQKN